MLERQCSESNPITRYRKAHAETALFWSRRLVGNVGASGRASGPARRCYAERQGRVVHDSLGQRPKDSGKANRPALKARFVSATDLHEGHPTGALNRAFSAGLSFDFESWGDAPG